jgi:hypothetical protein
MSLRTITLIAALALAAASGAAAQQVASPETSPRLRRLAELENHLNAGDARALESYLASAAAPELLARRPAAELAGELLGATRGFGAFEIIRAVPTGPGAARAEVAVAGRPVATISIRIEPAEPFRLLAVEVGDAAPAVLAAQAPPEALTAAMQRSVVDSIAVLVERMYTAPDTGRMIADRLRQREAAGAYRPLTQPQRFADALGEDMRAVNGDKHLRVLVGPPPMGGGPGGPGSAENGVGRVEVLTGNVGYLQLTGPMSGSRPALDAVTDALRRLAATDAVIVDLRGVPGGSAEMSNHVISHFTEPDVPSLEVYNRMTGERRIRYTLATVPGPRRTDVPLYVLVDGRSFSAAEDLPFVLQSLGRATIVGERTPGGGRNNMFVPVGYGLVASVTYTRVADPRTGREWEGVGVQPDLPAPGERALEAAHRHALERLGRVHG